MSEQKPSVGRIVHYAGHTAKGVECMAAIVTQVGNGDEQLGLHIFDPRLAKAISLESGGVWQDEDVHEGHTWHWPERV